MTESVTIWNKQKNKRKKEESGMKKIYVYVKKKQATDLRNKTLVESWNHSAERETQPI